MKYVLTAIMALSLGFGAGVFVGPSDVSARPPEVLPWHPGGGNGNGLVKEKRKIAVELCVAMARSGAYTDLDDNQFSDFCIKVASHLGDSAYDHTD